MTAGLGFFRGEGFAFARGSLLEGSIGVVMAGGFRDMLTVSGPGASTGMVSVSGRVGDTTGDSARLLTYTSSGALLDSDVFVSSGGAGSLQVAVDAPPGTEVLLVLEHVPEQIYAIQGVPPVSTRFDLAVDRIETSEGMLLTASSGGLRAVHGSYIYAPIPEPSTVALMLGGLCMLGAWSARSRTRRSRSTT